MIVAVLLIKRGKTKNKRKKMPKKLFICYVAINMLVIIDAKILTGEVLALTRANMLISIFNFNFTEFLTYWKYVYIVKVCLLVFLSIYRKERAL